MHSFQRAHDGTLVEVFASLTNYDPPFFPRAPPFDSDKLRVYLMEKADSGAQILCTSRDILSPSWGYPGTRDAEMILDIDMMRSPHAPRTCSFSLPSDLDAVETTCSGPMFKRGSVRIALRYRATLDLRTVPFGLIQFAASKTCVLADKVRPTQAATPSVSSGPDQAVKLCSACVLAPNVPLFSFPGQFSCELRLVNHFGSAPALTFPWGSSPRSSSG